jgi:hypothetical protein
MSIDGIGKPRGGVPAAGVGVPSAGTPKGERFDVGGSAAPQGVGAATGSDDLGRLQRGEIDVNTYLDGRVNGAVAHLAGALPPDQIAFVKQTLRDQLASDPVLSEFARRTTGQIPAAVED